MDAPHDHTTDPYVLEALLAVAEGRDPSLALAGYLSQLRDEWALDEVGLLAVGADGRARARAWAGSLPSDGGGFDAGWLAHGEIDPGALVRLRLRRVALWPAGPSGVVLLGRRDDGPLPAPCGDPLLTTLLLAESALASQRALGVIAGVVAAHDERSVWRAVDDGVAERFRTGVPCQVPVAGVPGRVEASAATPAEAEALHLIADVTAVALGRCEQAGSPL
jgi:hypothetical protein